jgi:hypothetical protein
VAPPKDISNRETDQTTEEGAQTIAGDCDAGDYIVGVAELFAEGRVL